MLNRMQYTNPEQNNPEQNNGVPKSLRPDRAFRSTQPFWKRGIALLMLLCTVALLAGAITGTGLAQGNKAVSVRVVDKAGYDKVVAAHKGKVVVVDCWATWCVPCRKAFPKTVQLAKEFSDKGVVVVSLSFDDVVKGEAPEKVKKFLVEQNAHFENLVSSLDISGDGADAYEITDGALPHFKIYGKDGKLFKKFESSEESAIKHEDVEAAVKAALKAK